MLSGARKLRARLQPSQREALVKLMRDEITAGPIFWAGRRARIEPFTTGKCNIGSSFLAEEKMKPLLNDVQWQNLQPKIDLFFGEMAGVRFEGQIRQQCEIQD